MEYIFVQDKIRIDQVLKNKQTTKNFTPIRAQKKNTFRMFLMMALEKTKI